MKKVSIISFLIFTILLCYFSTTYAAITVTEESLQKSFKKYATANNNNTTENNTESYDMQIDKTNKTITLTLDKDTYNIGYDLSEKPTFNVDLLFNKSMTKEEWENEANKTSLLMLMFVLIADQEGIDFMDSMTYMMSSAFKNVTSDQLINTSAITNAIEYAKLTYDKVTPINDTLFTWTAQKISETNDEYKAQATFIVNNDADFSIIKGSTDKLGNTIVDSMQNTANSIAQSVTNMVEQQEKVNQVTNSINKLPQTGKTFEITDALYLLCIVSSVALITIIFKSAKYKKI